MDTARAAGVQYPADHPPRARSMRSARAGRCTRRGFALIFIIDDDLSIQTSLARLSRSAGYEAQAFASAEEFLDAADAPDAASCVILDLHLPGMSAVALQEIL